MVSWVMSVADAAADIDHESVLLTDFTAVEVGLVLPPTLSIRAIGHSGVAQVKEQRHVARRRLAGWFGRNRRAARPIGRPS